MGGALLPLLPLYWIGIRETERFTRSVSGPRSSLLEEIARTASVARSHHRRRFVGITCVWFTINFWSGSALFFFAYYALGDRGWAPERLGVLYPLGGLAGFAGYALAGRLMDFAGRRIAASAYLLLGTVFVLLCYQSSSDAMISLGYVGLMFVGGIWAIAATMSAELFPAELRATANGVAHNLLGRWGMAIAPALAGAIAEHTGSTAHAVTILSVANVLCVPVIWALIPETRGVALDAPAPLAPQNSKPASIRNSRGSP
jgi:putative MFS transporter